MREVLEGEDGVGNENADAVHEHAAHPEPDVLAVGLVRVHLGEHPEGAEEDEGGVDEGVGEPFYEQPGREARPVDADPVEQRVPHEVVLLLLLREDLPFLRHILLMLEVEYAVEQDW